MRPISGNLLNGAVRMVYRATAIGVEVVRISVGALAAVTPISAIGFDSAIGVRHGAATVRILCCYTAV